MVSLFRARMGYDTRDSTAFLFLVISTVERGGPVAVCCLLFPGNVRYEKRDLFGREAIKKASLILTFISTTWPNGRIHLDIEIRVSVLSAASALTALYALGFLFENFWEGRHPS